MANNRIIILTHTVVIGIATILATILLGLVAISASFFSKSGSSVHRIARFWGWCILKVSGVRVDIDGLELLDPHGPYIFVANHQSQFDIPVVLSSLPYHFIWLAKAELFKIPIFGRGMRGAGYIPIDRSDRKSAFLSLEHAAQSIRSGRSVIIFPEGTRSSDGTLLPFKKGGFVLAVDAAVPIVPTLIRGTHEIMPKGSWLIRSHRVHIELLPVIESAAYTRKTKDELLDRVRQALLDAKQNSPHGAADA